MLHVYGKQLEPKSSSTQTYTLGKKTVFEQQGQRRMKMLANVGFLKMCRRTNSARL
ncbi:UNVERIFIED_CONTAM: hypothetical protein FKN15_017533 [Acipenser sinensis]